MELDIRDSIINKPDVCSLFCSSATIMLLLPRASLVIPQAEPSPAEIEAEVPGAQQLI